MTLAYLLCTVKAPRRSERSRACERTPYFKPSHTLPSNDHLLTQACCTISKVYICIIPLPMFYHQPLTRKPRLGEASPDHKPNPWQGPITSGGRVHWAPQPGAQVCPAWESWQMLSVPSLIIMLSDSSRQGQAEQRAANLCCKAVKGRPGAP